MLRRRASGIIIGNVGTLQGGVSLLPHAEPDDGVLDLLVLTAWGWSGWLALTVDVFLRRTRTGRVVHSEFRELRVQLDRPQLQVAIDATVAEVKLNDTLSYGVQFFLQNNKLGLLNTTSTAAPTPAGGLDVVYANLAVERLECACA